MDFENSKIELAKAENEVLITDPKAAGKRRRADRRRRRKYKFTDKKHSKLGIASAIMVLPALACLAAAIVLAVTMKGQAGTYAGVLPFMSMIISTAGIIVSGLTFRKPDTIFTFAWIGLIANIVIWLFVAFVLVVGL